MAFFRLLKQAFGFGTEEVYHEDDTPGIDATVVPLRKRAEDRVPPHTSSPVTPTSSLKDISEGSTSTATTSDSVDECDYMSRVIPSDIFKTVVEVFNRSLPDFLGDSVDASRQQKFLYDALDEGMKNYISSLDRAARRKYDQLRHADMLKTEGELKDLREALRRQEEESDEIKKSQLSAERQKRALAERVRELEKQIATLQAEGEQLDLENKSLVNKLRVNALQEKDLEAMRADSTELQEQMAKLRAENTRLSDALEQAKLRDTLGETMVSDLQGRASEAQRLVQEKEKELASALTEKSELLTQLAEMETLRDGLEGAIKRAEAAEKKVADTKTVVDDLRRQIDDIRAERDEARTLAEGNARQLAKAREKLTIVAEVQTQLEMLEETRLKTDAQISRFKDQILEKDELIRQKDSDISDKNVALYQKEATIKRLEDMNDSLRKQLEDAEFKHSQAQSAMREEISRLKNLPSPKLKTSIDSEYASESVVSKSDIKSKSKNPQPGKNASAPVTIVAKAPMSKAPETLAGSIDYALEDIPIIEKASESTVDYPKQKSKEKNTPAKGEGKSSVTPIEKKEPQTDIPDIDEDANWLIPTPPKNNRQEQESLFESDDFGYKEPPRRPMSDNPAQMSLF